MSTLLLDHLLHIERLNPASAETYVSGLYIHNKNFADYLDLCFDRNWTSRYRNQSIPHVKALDVPYGVHPGSLEKSLSIVRKFGFVDMSVESVPTYTMADVNASITKVLESIADIEQKFLRQILNERYPLMSLSQWKQFRKQTTRVKS